MRVALRVGYLGEGFCGYQRQPDRVTVEGSVIESLQATGLIADPRSSSFASAARTDRGVSALGQVVAFDPAKPAAAICERVNSELPRDIFAWAEAEVDRGFNPRKEVVSKTYLYLVYGSDAQEIQQCTRVFEGEHEFSQFCRPSERNTFRVIDEIRVIPGNPVLVSFKAKGFLWAQVRKIITAMRRMASGDLARETVERALQGAAPLPLPAAPAENLILWDIAYDGVEFRTREQCLMRAEKFLEESMSRLAAGLEVRRMLKAGLHDHAVVVQVP